MTNTEKKNLAVTACKVRMGVIEGTHGAKSGHPGGSLSASDLFTYLYFKEMNIDPKNPRWADRDRFVLSKGHTAPGLYAALAQRGYFPVEDLKTLRHIGTISEMTNVGASDAFKNLTTYSTSKDDVVNGVGALADRRNKIAQSIVDAASRNLQLNIDIRKLRAADSEALDQLSDGIGRYSNERQALERALSDLSRQVGGGSLDFSGSNFQDSISKVRMALNLLKNKLAEADRAIATRDQQIQRQKDELAGKDGQIIDLHKQLDAKSAQLNDLRVVLGIEKNEPLPMPWKPGSKEARRKVVGRVADVNSKYGYIAVSLGTDSTVSQPLGNKTGEINVNITPGLEMVVSRGDLEVPTSDFITKIKLTKVEKDCSIAEPIGVANGSVKVGDKVWFDIN